MDRLQQIDGDDQLSLVTRCMTPELSELAIDLFTKSPSFRDAETRAKVALLRYGKHMTPPSIRRTLAAIPKNSQIWNAIKIPSILESFFQIVEPHLEFEKDDWEQIMRAVIENGSLTPDRRSKP